MVDRRKHAHRAEVIHERTGAVVDGFARNSHVVRVHDAVDESDSEPGRHQLRLVFDDMVQKAERTVCFMGMAFDCVADKRFERLAIVSRAKVLERADPDMAGGNSGQHRAWQRCLAKDRLSRRHGSERPRRRHTEGRHCFRNDVFAQNGSEPRAAVPHSRIRRSARTLELDVEASPVGRDNLAEQDGAAVAELRRPAAELMAGIDLGQGVGPFGHFVAGQDRDAFRCCQLSRVNSQASCKRHVQGQHCRRGHRRRRHPGIEAVRQPSVRVVEGQGEAHGSGPARRAWQATPPSVRALEADAASEAGDAFRQEIEVALCIEVSHECGVDGTIGHAPPVGDCHAAGKF